MAPKYPSSQWDPGNNSLGAGSNFVGLVTAVLGSMATVTLGTQIAGEDLTNDLQKVEQRYSYSTFTSASTVAVKSGAGFLRHINIGAISCPSLVVYDSTTPSGTVIHRFNANAPVGTYTFDVSFSTGLSVDAIAGSGGVAPMLCISYR